ncbi:MAG TPA: hypothetical protein HA276_02720, partial [Candidatus Poseidoniaceae archaeon]|nr:hypothetical protein [Candidatus Poseidoniaceae archaeon]
MGRLMTTVVLLVACEGDEASASMLDALLKRDVMLPSHPVEGALAYARGRVRLW